MIHQWQARRPLSSVDKSPLVLGAVFTLCIYLLIQQYGYSERILKHIHRRDISLNITGITPFQEICPKEYPPAHSILHDSQHHEIVYYNVTISEQLGRLNRGDEPASDLPDVYEFNNYMFAAWRTEKLESEASAWDAATDEYVKGPGWSKPKKDKLVRADITVLEGDYVAFNSWYIGNFGHFAHDWLPTIALLRHIVPETTKFLLVEDPMSKQFIRFLDPFFYERVVWVQYDHVYHTKGKLTLQVPYAIPNVYGCCTDWDPLRQWIAENHPDKSSRKHVIFYSRRSSDTHHGRLLDPSMEERAINRIRKKLMQYGRDEKIIIFNGQDAEGNTLSLLQQYALFRGASAFIGPHGSGLGGNFLWMDPFPSKCDERPKILEFIPGPLSRDIQALYASYYSNIRKWPLEYHTLLYRRDSTINTTQINLDTFDDALDAMWGSGASPVAKDKEEGMSAAEE